ncbi:MAG: DPP IV N-terminal domain-containing protein [Planctomycetota bacterium]|jgi:dipeptidyl-peptidase-4
MARSFNFASATIFVFVSPSLLALVFSMAGSIAGIGQLTWAEDGGKSRKVASPSTIAERSNFMATSRELDVQSFLESLDKSSSHAKLIQYGSTTENRPLLALVLSREQEVQLPLPAEDPRLLVVMIGNIHSGECDGKEALLALARDLVQDGSHPFLEKAVLVIAPNFNADGNERVGVLHRPGQDGPALGMGTRENAMGLDLNRDFVKLDSPEVRSLVRLLDAWNADVLFDAHTTNGSLHRYDMTYDIPHNPAANPDMVAWMRGTMMPRVGQAMRDRGAPVFYYGNFNRDHTIWESYGFEPRYSTEYMGLRGKMGILVESYSYASYERRIEVSYAFIEECLKALTENAQTLKPMLNPAARPTPMQAPMQVPIQGKIVAAEGEAQVAGYAWPDPKPDSPFPSPKDRDRVKDLKPTEYQVTLMNRGVASLQVDAPKFYFVPEEYSWAASRLRLHGIPLIPFPGREVVEAGRYRIQSRKELNEFQFRKMSQYDVQLESAAVEIGPGWIVSTDHPLGTLATYLLEPHSNESLASWGFFDPSLREGSLYGVVRLNESPKSLAARSLPKLGIGQLKPTDIRGERLTLEKLFDPKQRVSYSAMPAPIPKWLPESDSYLLQRENRWFEVDALSGSMKPFALPLKMVEALEKLPGLGDGQAAQYGRQINLFDSKFKTALIQHKKDLILYDADSQTATALTETPDVEEEFAELSPSRGHVAFVRDQNLWVVDCKTRQAKALTTDGGGEILNGKLDWVYQEEVYGRGQFKAFWWNHDGSRIAYLRLDESPVPNFVIDDSLSFAQRIENMRYPKAGQNNPLASLHVVDIATGTSAEVGIENYPQPDRLIVRVGWKPNEPDQLVFQVQNRIQSKLDVMLFDASTRAVRTLAHEESKAWIDVIDLPRWLPDGSFLWLHDDAHGRRHISRIRTSGERQQLTSGDWDVKEISSVAEDGKSVWFIGHRSAPTNSDVLRLQLDSGEIQLVSNQLGSHRIAVHPRGQYYFDSASDLDTPAELWLRNAQGASIRYAGGFRNDRLDYVDSTAPRLMQIPARDGQLLQAMLYAPSEKTIAGLPNQRAATVIHVYGGPSAPTVENTWTRRSDLWHRYLADQGIAVLLCDNRSALGKGNSDTWRIYRDLGAIELLDLEDAARWLAAQSWADPERIGLWGWSYGGYFTAYALTHSKLFKAGIAGAPVTDWRNYDSIYTERYMDTPQANPEGYKTSSVVEAAANLHGKLLLIHGEIDDNVHMANTLQLAHALQRAGKEFELMVYPSNRHGITDPMQVYHQYRMMTNFFEKSLR